MLQQGADDANDKDGKAKNEADQAAKKPVKTSADEHKDPRQAAREEKQRLKEEKRQAKEEARAQRKLEREAEKEYFADQEQAEAESEVAGHDDPRAALAALLGASVGTDALDPALAPEPQPEPVAEPQPAAEQELHTEPVVAAESKGTPLSEPEPVTQALPEPIAHAASAPRPAGSLPAEIPNQPVDPAKKYEWTAPHPVSAATEPAANAEPVATQQLGVPLTPAGKTKKSKGSNNGDDGGKKQRVVAWSVVAAIVVVAFGVSAAIAIPAIVNHNAQPTPSPTKTTSAPTPSPTKTTSTPTPSPTKTSNGDAPVVDPGATSPMDIQTWGVTVQVSGKFGRTEYQITGNTLLITSVLTDSFPESCAALRTGWGMEKASPPAKNGVVVNGNAFNLVKPAGTCAADPDLYKQVWGLTQAMVNSTKALP